MTVGTGIMVAVGLGATASCAITGHYVFAALILVVTFILGLIIIIHDNDPINKILKQGSKS